MDNLRNFCVNRTSTFQHFNGNARFDETEATGSADDVFRCDHSAFGTQSNSARATFIESGMKRMFKELRYRVTFGIADLIFAVCLSCFGLTQQDLKGPPADRKTNTELTIQVTASRSLVKLPPKMPEIVPVNCEPTESKVRLNANSTSPHKAESFTWQVPVGRLIGKTRAVAWDLSGVEAGTYTATVEASDKHKHTASGSITVSVVICPGERPDPPPCPSVTVACPSSVESKDTLTFEAFVVGGNPEIMPTYKWKLSAGKIISGRATRKITVDVSRLSHESVTATVSLRGLNPLCSADASCMTQIR